jgi:endonuclease/exonuclease/phosphatase family metal-dependent hydrolase
MPRFRVLRSSSGDGLDGHSETWESFSPWSASSWEGFSPWNRYCPRSDFDHPPEVSRIPAKKEERLRFFTLNVAHGRQHNPSNVFLGRRRLQQNITAIADIVRALTPDVVALQEADGRSSLSGGFDHVAALARQAELHDHYRGNHTALRLGRFNVASGTAILARQPLLEPISHRFDLSWRDTKGFVAATVVVPEWGGLEVDVVSVHLDFLVPGVRRRQILQMVDRLILRRRPLVVLGDLNCCFEREPKSMRLLVETLGLKAYEPDSRAHTYPSRRPRRRLDWILVSDELEYCGYHTVHLPLSDHSALVADIHLRG